MPLREKVRNFIKGPPLEDLVIDLKMYNKEIARTRDKYRERAKTLYDQAKESIVKGDIDAVTKFFTFPPKYRKFKFFKGSILLEF